MIQIDDGKFTILNIGFNGDSEKMVEFESRVSDGKSEGNVLFMDVANDTLHNAGEYLPLVLDKEELKVYIRFLQGNLKIMEDRD